MRKTSVFASAVAALTLASVSFPLHAAEEPVQEAAPAAKLTPEQIENIRRAGGILRAFTVAMQEKDVQEPVKGRLLACLYNNKLSTISAATGKVLKENSQLSEDKPADVYRAAASVCGISFKKMEEGAPPPPSSRSEQEGR